MRHRVLALCLCLASLAGIRSTAPAAAASADPSAVRAMVRGLRLVNWFPTLGAHDRMWSHFDPGAIDRDFATIAALHANAVRIIPDVRVFTFPSPPPAALDELSRTVSLAAAHRLRVQLTLFDQFKSYTDIDGSRQWARAVLSRLAPHDPRIAFVELQNEIGPQDEDSMRWARQLLPFVRDASGGSPVTVSVDAPASNLVDLQLALGSATPDLWDLHYYSLPASALATFREAARIAAPRPLLIGEVGYSTFPGDQAIPGVPQTAAAQEAYQDYVLRAMELAAAGAGLPPAAPWLVNDFPCTECTPSGCVSDCSAQCDGCHAVDDFYGLFRADGGAKPAAATMARILAGAPVDRDVDLGFERDAGGDPAFWRILSPGGATLRRDAGVAHSGTASALIQGSPAGATPDPCWAAEPLTAPTPGGRATLGAWVRGAAATGRTYVDLVWLDWEGQEIGDQASPLLPEGDSGWTRLSASGTAPDGTVAAQLRLCSAANSGTAWFDDVSIETR